MKILSNRIIVPLSTEKQISSIKKVFLDECILFKSDIEEYELIIILRPKKLGRIALPDSSVLPVEYNRSNKLFSIIRHYLSQAKCVEKILFLKEDDIFHIWTIISDYYNEDNRKAVYKKEGELMDFLSKADFNFDFYLIESVDVEDVLSSGAVIIYDRPKI